MKIGFAIIGSLILCLNVKCQTVEKVKAKDAFEMVCNRDMVNTILLDGRSEEMYAEKHIVSAINIDAFDDFLSEQLKDYLQKDEIIVYCTNHDRAEIIIKELKELQYQGNIVFISDGINGWISAGYTTEKKEDQNYEQRNRKGIFRKG